MIDFLRLLELVYIDGFRCEISGSDKSVFFVWRGFDESGRTYCTSRALNRKMLALAVAPEDIIIHMVTDVRKGLEKMQ